MNTHEAPLCIQFMQTAKPTQKTLSHCSTGTIIIRMYYTFKYSKRKKFRKNEGDSSTNLSYINMTTEFFQEHKKRSHWDKEK